MKNRESLQWDAFRRIWMRPEIVWSRVGAGDECRPWLGRTQGGYGQVDVGRTAVLAHRAAYFLANGYIALDECVMHACDNPACCNPAHLSLGSHAENMADMARKGRRRGINAGVQNGRAKLTRELATEILLARERGALLRELAQLYGVGASTISRVVRRENWNG